MAISYSFSDNPEQVRETSNPELPQIATTFIHFQDVNADWNGDYSNAIVTEKDAIGQRIMNVLLVIPGEEWGEPLWGSGVQLELFETAGDGTPTDRTAMSLETQTLQAVALFMAREVVVDQSKQFVSLLPSGDGYFINLPFYIKSMQAIGRVQRRLTPYSTGN